MTLESIDSFDQYMSELLSPGGVQFFYHITNQTAAGGSAEFPVLTDVALVDLRLTEVTADGSGSTIALFDIDGVSSDRLSSASVFLETLQDSDSIVEAIYRRNSTGRVTLDGRLESDLLEVQTAHGDPVQIVRVDPKFRLDIPDPCAGIFLTITVEDREGVKYPVGTFGIGQLS